MKSQSSVHKQDMGGQQDTHRQQKAAGQGDMGEQQDMGREVHILKLCFIYKIIFKKLYESLFKICGSSGYVKHTGIAYKI